MDDVIFAHKLTLLDVAARLRQVRQRLTRSLGRGALEYPLHAADTRNYFLQSGLLGVLNIYDIMFAYNAHAHIATGK